MGNKKERKVIIIDQNDENPWSWLLNKGLGASFLCISLFALLVRIAVSLHPYSGAGNPPKFGDFEAQRHWMEITTNLPVKEWYRNSTANDLSYWGLDYPPLTAYQSYVHGIFLKSFLSESVSLFTSRGHESYLGKLLMRWTVLSSDILVFLPAVFYFVLSYSASRPRRHQSDVAWLVAMILMNPCLIVIDHGHFQFNCISLGLTIGAVAAIISSRELVACALFTLALSHKQMSAYFAPAFFSHLLGRCLRRRNNHPKNHKMSATTVQHISECFIKPKYEVEEAKKPYYLAPMDLTMFCVHYIQKGLLFTKPSQFNGQPYSTHNFLESLKDSLSLTLVHFYPLAGRLVTQVDEDQHQCLIFVDCNKGPGAKLIHATLDMTVSDILSPTDVPLVVQSFFDHDRAVNHDGHNESLLTIQVTELVDGVFIGCSMNHALGDGTSYWLFWNMWSEIHQSKHKELVPVSRMPVLERWFPEGYGPTLYLPYVHPDEFVTRHESPRLRERIFHFSPKSMARLKEKANEENIGNNISTISSFKALSALCWRTIVRANGLSRDQVTNCRLATNNRHRLDPPLSPEYFGNCISAMATPTTVGELLDNNLGWAAALLHQSVLNHSDKVVRDFVNKWLQAPYVYPMGMFDSSSVMMGSSPRFDMYGNEFGLGKAVALRSGYANKFVGKVTSYEGYEGGGSVDLEICLPPDSMKALESDEEFMSAVSPPSREYVTI